jgi:hypothetical protein
VTERFGIPYIDEGMQAGVARALRHGLEPPPSWSEETRIGEAFMYVISSWPVEELDTGAMNDLSERFILLFVENVTVAAIARSVYESAPLEIDDIRAFLAHSVVFFDSFKHR